jgi:hypothetical protein
MVFFERYTDGIKRVIFFLLVYSVSKFVDNNIFLLPTDLPADKIINERFTDGAFLLVISLVNYLLTEYVSYADRKISSVKL